MTAVNGERESDSGLDSSNPAGLVFAQELKKRAARSGVALVGRQLLTKPLGLFANIVLARLLIPEEFGVYALISTAVSLCNVLGDAGLATALVRSEEEPSAEVESAVFTFQQIITALPLLILMLCAPVIVGYFHLPLNTAWLLRVTALSGLISTFRQIPSVRLQRRLHIDTLARVEIVQALVFNGASVAFAISKLGAWSFALASVLSQLTATVMVQYAEPWRPRWSFNWRLCRPALAFGIKVQTTAIVNSARDNLINAWVGVLCGATCMGYIGFATMTAQYPIAASSAIFPLFIPLFSRVQGDIRELTRVAETVIRVNCWITLGVSSVLVPLAPPLVSDVFGIQWMPSLPLIYLFCSTLLTAGINFPMFGLCDAIGRPDIPLRNSCWLTIGNLVSSIPLVYALGPIGLGVAQMVLVLFYIPMYQETRKVVPVRLTSQVLPTALAALANSLLVLVSVQHVNSGDLLGLFAVAAIGGLSFLLLANLIWRNELLIQGRNLMRVAFS